MVVVVSPEDVDVAGNDGVCGGVTTLLKEALRRPEKKARAFDPFEVSLLILIFSHPPFFFFFSLSVLSINSPSVISSNVNSYSAYWAEFGRFFRPPIFLGDLPDIPSPSSSSPWSSIC